MMASAPATTTCVACGHREEGVAAFVEYSPGNIKLQRCAQCHGTIDKYVEYEDLLVATDVVLHKLAAHRHVLFNRERSNRRRVWAFAFNSLIEFYIRMYYLDECDVDAAAAARAAAASAGFYLASLLVGAAAVRLGQHSLGWSNAQPFSAEAFVDAVALGSAIKVLFVMMSIWTYPTRFLLVLRLLSLSCTALSMHAVLPDAHLAHACAIALIVSACQCLGGGLQLPRLLVL